MRGAHSDLREKLAELAHEQWSGWMEYLFSKCEEYVEGEGLHIPVEFVIRWQGQRVTGYADLTEEEKESDRAEADRVLALMRGAHSGGAATGAVLAYETGRQDAEREACAQVDAYVAALRAALRAARLERVQLAAYVTELRERAEAAGPQAYAFTYRFVADEIEKRFLTPASTPERVKTEGTL